jgi:hypothetical protein
MINLIDFFYFFIFLIFKTLKTPFSFQVFKFPKFQDFIFFLQIFESSSNILLLRVRPIIATSPATLQHCNSTTLPATLQPRNTAISQHRPQYCTSNIATQQNHNVAILQFYIDFYIQLRN